MNPLESPAGSLKWFALNLCQLSQNLLSYADKAALGLNRPLRESQLRFQRLRMSMHYKSTAAQFFLNPHPLQIQ